MKRTAILIYGAASYAIFFGVFLYLIGFVGNFIVPATIDGEATTPFLDALIINLALVGLFGVQHSVMARPGFKRLWTRVIPKEAERNTYVLLTSVALIILFWQWRPMDGTLWHIENPIGQGIMYGFYALGWLTVLGTTFLINHFDLFGLRQAWLQFRGKPYSDLHFVTPLLYKLIRHPLYVGWFLTFWATPSMSVGHLIYAVGMTTYIAIAIPFEEQDLVDAMGESYKKYMNDVPRFIPRFTKRAAESHEAIHAIVE